MRWRGRMGSTCTRDAISITHISDDATASRAGRWQNGFFPGWASAAPRSSSLLYFDSSKLTCDCAVYLDILNVEGAYESQLSEYRRCSLPSVPALFPCRH